MKLKSSLVAAGFILAAATAAQAGPQISISIGSGGGYCPPRPVYCQQPVYYRQPVVYYYNSAPVCYGNGGFGTQQVVTYGPPVYRVAPPVYTTQPVQVYQQSPFRWR